MGNALWLANTDDYFYTVGGTPRTTGGYGIHPNYNSFLGTELTAITGYAVTRFAQIEDRSHYVSGCGRSPGSRLCPPFDARTCEAHQARISRTCGGGDGLARDPLARRALTYGVAAVARGRHRLIGCRR